MSNSNKNWLNKRNCATGILCCVAVAAVYAGFFYEKPGVAVKPPNTNMAQNMPEKNEPVVANKNATPKIDSAKIDKAEETATVSKSDQKPLDQENKSEEKKDVSINQEEVVDESVSVMTEDSSGLIWPVSGEIVMDFSIDTAIYDVTLDQYRTNEFVSIAANVGDSVKASGNGTVEFVGVDAERGNMVVINHNDGWKTTYCQLQDGILVKEGQKVKQGQKIGQVAETSMYGVALGDHIDFKVTNNDSSVDPKLTMAQ